MTHPSLDFNDVPQVAAPRDGRDEIRAQLLDRLESVLTALFPAGRTNSTVRLNDAANHWITCCCTGRRDWEKLPWPR